MAMKIILTAIIGILSSFIIIGSLPFMLEGDGMGVLLFMGGALGMASAAVALQKM